MNNKTLKAIQRLAKDIQKKALKDKRESLAGAIYNGKDTYMCDGYRLFVAYNDLVEENEQVEPLTNREKVQEFVRQDNMKTTDEVIDFCETNNIDYIFFENTQELFDYYDEEDYQSFSNGIIDVIFKNGNMLKILN